MSVRNSVTNSSSINEQNTTGNEAEALYENYHPSSKNNNDKANCGRTTSLNNETSSRREPTIVTKSESVHLTKKPQPLPKPKPCVREAVQSFERGSVKTKPGVVGEAVMKFQSSQNKSNKARFSLKAPLTRSYSSTISGVCNSDTDVDLPIGQKSDDIEIQQDNRAAKKNSVVRTDSMSNVQIKPVAKSSVPAKPLPSTQSVISKKQGDNTIINTTKTSVRNQISAEGMPSSSKTLTQSNDAVEFSAPRNSTADKNRNITSSGSIMSQNYSSIPPNRSLYTVNTDESDIYEEAARVQVALLPSEERRQIRPSSKRHTYANANNIDDEPIYDEAMVVRKSTVAGSGRSDATFKPSPHQGYQSTVVDQDACLYEEASTVCANLKLKDTKLPNPPQSRNSALEATSTNNKHSVNDDSLIYDAAMPVRLPSTADQHNLQEECIYESALPVTTSKLQQAKPRNVSQSVINLPNNASSSGYSDENIYEEAAAVVLPSKTGKKSALAQGDVTGSECLSDSTEDEEGFDSENQKMLMSLRRSSRHMLYLCRNDTILAKQKVEHDAKRMSSNFMAKHDASGAHTFLEDENLDLDVDTDDAFIGNIKDEKMRMWVVSNILDSEMEYLGNLELLHRYQIYLKKHDKGTLSSSDFVTMFGLLVNFFCLHKEFVDKLKPKVDNWSEDQEVAGIYKELVVNEFPKALEYLMNYQKALTIYQQRCGQSFQQFLQLNSDIPKDSSLETLLHKPVVQLQRSNLMLHDLLRHTPPSHPDYNELRNIKKLACGYLSEFSGNSGNEGQRSLVRKGVLIELKGNSRKLRQILLFSDALVCARQTTNRFQQYEVCWYIQLSELQLEHKFSSQEEKKAAMFRQQENESLQRQRIQLRADYRAELKRLQLQAETDSGGEGSAHESGIKVLQSRNLDKIRKKLLHVDEQLVVQSAYLQLKLSDSRTSYTLLLSSDYERNNWKDAIDGLLSKPRDAVKLTLSDVHNMINSQKVQKPAPSLSDDECLLEEERLSGCLSVTIHRLQGLKNVELGTFCSVEIDSFGHFSLRAKTNVSKSADCKWDEDFNIDLEGAQTLHILCYQIASKTDYLLGQCSLAFQKSWLDEEFKEKSISLGNGLLLTISLKFISSDQLAMKRRSMNQEMTSTNVFGLDISTLVKRENTKVPMVITSCVEELERRGLREVGLYRVSGLSEHVERLKKAFNKNCISAVGLLRDTDSNVLTSLIKQFLRELPEVLFTDQHYSAFVDGFGLVDPFSREKFMICTLKKLPLANYRTIIYFLHHLVRVSHQSEQNKMTLASLATVLGPTLLRPSTVKSNKSSTPSSLFVDSISDASIQSSILLFYLNLMSRGPLDTVVVNVP